MPYKDPEVKRQKGKEYYQNHRDAIISKNSKYFEEHKDHLKEYKKKRYANFSVEEKELLNLKARISYHKNKDKRLLNKKEYRVNNKHIAVANSAKRRASKLKRTPIWLSDFDKLKIKCIYSIASMLTRVNNELWVVDHIIPLQGKLVSGLHTPNNLQVIHARKNESKFNKYEIV